MLGRILLVGGAISLTSACFYITHLHRSLAAQIHWRVVSVEERKALCAAGELRSLPTEVIEHPEQFRIVHESDAKTGAIAIPSDPGDAEALLTKRLRSNMIAFAGMPTGRILHFMAKSPEQKRSFSLDHLETLQFQPGDICCGMYRVVEREPVRAEIEMLVPANMGNFYGRLIISLRKEGGETVLTTDTIQWTETDSSIVMPLERRLGRFMHEIASWNLLVNGVKFLEERSPSRQVSKL